MYLEEMDEKEFRMPPVEPIEDSLRRKGITEKVIFMDERICPCSITSWLR